LQEVEKIHILNKSSRESVNKTPDSGIKKVSAENRKAVLHS
jgi:hypothetical protein